MSERFFAPCPRGLEPILADELGGLGAEEIVRTDGGVGARGPLDLAYHANLESRVASRVLWEVGAGHYADEHDVIAHARTLPWPEWFAVTKSLRVNIAATRSPIASLDYVTLAVKDAVCDTFRATSGHRPDIEKQRPDVRVHVHLTDRLCTFYLDTSGEPLFKRGYRRATEEAPLRENLAAGILAMAGYTAQTTLLDPLCGSGTIAIEAALIAADRAPGAWRDFGFRHLSWFDGPHWQRTRDRARQRARVPAAGLIHASDIDARAIAKARTNAAAAGVEGAIVFTEADVLDRPPPAAEGLLVTNPPYGIRIDEARRLAAFYPQLGTALKQRYAGWTAWLLSADLRLPSLIGLKPARRIPLYNGALECRLFGFPLVAGSHRRTPRGTGDPDPSDPTPGAPERPEGR